MAVACRRASPPTTRAAPQPSAHDRLAPGETPPGVEHAFELPLPRGARIDGRFGDEVVAQVPATIESFANRVRELAPHAEAVVGPNGTTFPDVVLPETPAKAHLRVTIIPYGDGRTTRVIVLRWTDPPPVPTASHDELMRRSGLTPDGKLLDPNHLE